jgi:hypothetical protein
MGRISPKAASFSANQDTASLRSEAYSDDVRKHSTCPVTHKTDEHRIIPRRCVMCDNLYQTSHAANVRKHHEEMSGTQTE